MISGLSIFHSLSNLSFPKWGAEYHLTERSQLVPPKKVYSLCDHIHLHSYTHVEWLGFTKSVWMKLTWWHIEYTNTTQSKHCGFCIKINGQVGQGGEDGLVRSGVCLKDSQDDFDSEYIGFDGSPDDLHGIRSCRKSTPNQAKANSATFNIQTVQEFSDECRFPFLKPPRVTWKGFEDSLRRKILQVWPIWLRFSWCK